LIKAAFIAAKDICQQRDRYMARWRTIFGNGMMDIDGANVLDGIRGDPNQTKHRRDGRASRAKGERMRFSGGSCLEEVSGEVVHQDEQGRRAVMGTGKLSA
jgi:hypothetical protein